MARQLARPMEFRRLAAALAAEARGPADTLITGVASLASAAPGDLCFFADSKFLEQARLTAATAIICRPEDVAALPAGLSKIIHKAPHLAFAQALDVLFPVAVAEAKISPQAVVGTDAQLDGVQVEAFSQIGARTRIGAGSIIHGHVNIGDDVRMGQGCVIHPHVTLYPGTVLGDRCIVHAGTVIGADGFGFQPTAKGWLKVQQVGSVVIGNDVEIGANTAIDCGAIDDTIIADGVKIDNLVQIAHNCQIGAHTAIAACVGIAGSTRIGSRCMIGGAAMIVGHIDICDDVIVSGGTVIAASIAAPGRYTGIFPSTDHRSWSKVAAQLRRSVNRRAKAE